MKSRESYARHGFSLVELSIVLVVLGLLTGGILTGQSLIRAAGLRSVTNDISRYLTVTNSFREKYLALPGDLRNATAFWGPVNVDPAICRASTGTGTQTCDGDGDGMLMHNAPASNERFRFWQHLANAGLIEGTYTGIQGAGGPYDSIIGQNVPATRIGNGGFYANWAGTFTAHSSRFDGYYGNEIRVGSKRTNDATDDILLQPEEAWNIDIKLDDGKPAFGKIRTRKQGSASTPNCATTTISSTAEYDLLRTTAECCFFVLTGF